MATLVINRFTSWSLSPEEVKAGSILTDLQVKVLQNQLAEIASEKISLVYDASNPLKFAQREAELQGQMGIIEYLLSQHQMYVEPNLNLELE